MHLPLLRLYHSCQDDLTLRNWKCPKTPDLKDWIDGMIKIASYECMLGRLQSEGEIKNEKKTKNMGSFLAVYKKKKKK